MHIYRRLDFLLAWTSFQLHIVVCHAVQLKTANYANTGSSEIVHIDKEIQYMQITLKMLKRSSCNFTSLETVPINLLQMPMRFWIGFRVLTMPMLLKFKGIVFHTVVLVQAYIFSLHFGLQVSWWAPWWVWSWSPVFEWEMLGSLIDNRPSNQFQERSV